MYRVKEEWVASENTEERYYSSWYVYDGLEKLKGKLCVLNVWYRTNYGDDQRQFSENICSGKTIWDLEVSEHLSCCKISCLPASPRIFEQLKNGLIAYF